MLKILARLASPGARETLQKCLKMGTKKRKQFAQIVRETPRHEGETPSEWIRYESGASRQHETRTPEYIEFEELESSLSEPRVKRGPRPDLDILNMPPTATGHGIAATIEYSRLRNLPTA